MSNLVKCDLCNGTGVIKEDGGDVLDCTQCDGSGWVEPRDLENEPEPYPERKYRRLSLRRLDGIALVDHETGEEVAGVRDMMIHIPLDGLVYLRVDFLVGTADDLVTIEDGTFSASVAAMMSAFEARRNARGGDTK